MGISVLSENKAKDKDRNGQAQHLAEHWWLHQHHVGSTALYIDERDRWAPHKLEARYIGLAAITPSSCLLKATRNAYPYSV